MTKRFYRGRERITRRVPGDIQRHIRAQIERSIQENADVFPNLAKTILETTRATHGDVRTLKQAISRLTAFENITTGGEKRADVLFRHPTGSISARIGFVAWTPEGVTKRPVTEYIVWPIAGIFEVEPQPRPRRGWLF